MNLWRRTRTEVAGAWRSVRYDMGQRPAEPPAGAGADLTSTGMSTFAGAGFDDASRPRRRLVAVSALAVLAVTGAAGTYVAMAGGLGALRIEKPAAPRPYPLAAAAPPAVASTSGLGQGAVTGSGPDAPAAAPPVLPVATAAAPAAVPTRALHRQPRTAPERADAPPPRPCACPGPPVPTPTEPSASPSGSPSPSASPSDSASPSPSPSPSGSGSTEALMRRRHRHGY